MDIQHKKRTINYQNIAWTREKKIDNNILLEKLDSFKESDFEIKPMPRYQLSIGC